MGRPVHLAVVAGLALLAACGGDDDGSPTGTTAPGTTATAPTTATTTTAPAAGAVPTVEITTLRDSTEQYSYQVEVPALAGLADPVADRVNAEITRRVQTIVANFVDGATQPPAEARPPSPSTLELSHQPGTVLAPTYAGLRLDGSLAMSFAATSNALAIIFNFDLLTGDPLILPDLFSPDADHLGRLSTLAREAILAQLGDSVAAETVELGTEPESENFRLWVLAPDGLQLIFAQGQVAPRVAGPVSVTIPYEELADITAGDGPISRIR